jgi:hypothetical protein
MSPTLPPGLFLSDKDLIKLKSPTRIQSSKAEVSKLYNQLMKAALSREADGPEIFVR